MYIMQNKSFALVGCFVVLSKVHLQKDGTCSVRSVQHRLDPSAPGHDGRIPPEVSTHGAEK